MAPPGAGPRYRYHGGEIRFYVDGNLSVSGTSGNTAPFGANDVRSIGEPGFIGANVDEAPALTPSDFMGGLFDDVAFYDNALSQSAIQGIMQNGVPESASLCLFAVTGLAMLRRSRRHR